VGITAPTVATEKFGEVSAIDAVATYDAETSKTNIFVVNRDPENAHELRVSVRDLAGGAGSGADGSGASGALPELLSAVTLHHDDHTWQATADDDTSVAPQPNATARIEGDQIVVNLPAISWSHIALG
jgi:alpha-N-arabinofuranosidase